MNWIAGPWVWDTTKPGMPFWRPPAGYSGLDLRSLPDHAAGSELSKAGWGVFVGAGAASSDYVALGSGSWDDVRPTGRALSAIPRRSGFSPTGATLKAILLSCLCEGASPDGSDGPKPIDLDAAGTLTLQVTGGGHHSEWGSWANGRHANVLRTKVRLDFAAVFAGVQDGHYADPDIHRRLLDYWCHKYGVGDWTEFVPPALQPHVPGRLLHRTTRTDDFNRANGAIGSSAEGWAWVAIAGTWTVLLNQATKSAGASAVQFVRADAALSSADHYCQLTRISTTAGLDYQGPCARADGSGAQTFYTTFCDATLYLTKLVAGTQTNMATTPQAVNANDVYKVQANGSTLTAYVNGAQLLSTTDTAITGNLFTGMDAFGVGATMDNFQAADLPAIIASGFLMQAPDPIPRVKLIAF